MNKKSMAAAPSGPQLVVANTDVNRQRGPAQLLIAKVVLVTATWAKEALQHLHPSQRKVIRRLVAAYVRAMKRGSWRLSHQAICFDRNGCLIDGQHRLLALIAAGVELYMLVVWNEAADFRDPIDCGRSRTMAFRIGQPPRITGALQLLLQMEDGEPLGSTTVYTQDELLEVHARHEDDLDELAGLGIKSDLFAGVRAACLWAMPINREKVLDWARQFHTGAGCAEGSSVLTFRDWFHNEVKGRRILPSYVLNAALASIRQHILGQPLSKIQHMSDASYRASCAQRRALGIPCTPTEDEVPSDTVWDMKGKDHAS